MRTTVLTMLATVFSLSAAAQFEKGRILLGGASNLGFSSGKTDSDQDDNEVNFNLDLKVGYFVIDNLNAGLGIDFASFKEGDASISSLGVGPYLRYYFPFKMFGELSYAFGSQKIDFGDGDATASTGDLGITVGYAIMVTDRFAVEPSFGFHATSYKPEEGDTSTGSNVALNIGLTLFLGE